MQDLSYAFGLNICNDGTNEWDDDWTFCSFMGIKRKIDFIMASRSLVVRHCIATNEIDMGSDHRAVKTCFDIGGTRYWEKHVTPKIKGWRPCLDPEGIPKQFQDVVHELSVGKETCRYSLKHPLRSIGSEPVCSCPGR